MSAADRRRVYFASFTPVKSEGHICFHDESEYFLHESALWQAAIEMPLEGDHRIGAVRVCHWDYAQTYLDALHGYNDIDPVEVRA